MTDIVEIPRFQVEELLDLAEDASFERNCDCLEYCNQTDCFDDCSDARRRKNVKDLMRVVRERLDAIEDRSKA